MKRGWEHLEAEELDFEMTWSRKEHDTSEVPGKSVIFTLNQYENVNVYSSFLSDDVQGENEKTEEGTLVLIGQKHFQRRPFQPYRYPPYMVPLTMPDLHPAFMMSLTMSQLHPVFMMSLTMSQLHPALDGVTDMSQLHPDCSTYSPSL